MKTTKKLLAVLLMVLIVALCAPVSFAADVVASGTCGTNLTWTLDDEGLLTVSGEGYMSDYNFDDMPWYDYRDNIKSLIIEEGVISVGIHAFWSCEKLETVSISDSVETIGDEAFEACYNLKSLTIGNGVKSIGHSAFAYCYDLENVTIPDSVETIGGYAFGWCQSLKTATIGSGAKNIGKIVFSGCLLVDVIIDENNPNYSYKDGYLLSKDGTVLIVPLTTVDYDGVTEIPEGVKEIKAGAFSNFSLTTVEIPEGVETIGEYAFYNISNDVRCMLIPKSVTSIGSKAIAYHDDLWESDIYYEAGVWEDYVLFVYEGTAGETYAKNNSIEYILIDNLSGVPCGDNATWSLNRETGTLTISGTGAVSKCTWQIFAKEITSVVVEEGITEIKNNVFSATVGNAERMSELGFVTTCMKTLSLPATLTAIDEDALGCCYSIEEISVAEDNEYFTCEDGVLFNKDKTELIKYACGKADKKYEIPSTVKKIGTMAFGGAINLEEVVMPESVEEIGVGAFMAATSLKKINISSKVKSIPVVVFYCCADLETLVLPEGLEELDMSSFGVCVSLKTLDYPKNAKITNGGDSEYFYSNMCMSLTDIYVPSSAKEYGFESANLKNVDFGGVNYGSYLNELKNNFSATKKTENFNIDDYTDYYKAYLNLMLKYEVGVDIGEVFNSEKEVDIYDVLDDDFGKNFLVLGEYDYSGITVKSHYNADFEAAVKELGANYVPYDDSHVITYTYENKTSCTESVLATKVECSICGIIGENITIEGGSHNVESWVVDKEATCIEQGSKSGACPDCGETVIAPIAFADHSYGEWKITTEPTTTAEGKAERSCSVCGGTQEKILEKLEEDKNVDTDTDDEITDEASYFKYIRALISLIRELIALIKTML